MKEVIYELKVERNMFNEIMKNNAPLILNLKKEKTVSVHKIKLIETTDGEVTGREMTLRILKREQNKGRKKVSKTIQPNAHHVGQRIKKMKEKMGVTYKSLGKRLGVKPSTLSKWALGYSLAPLKVVEKISKITGKPVGWFYFGDLRDYIQDYLKACYKLNTQTEEKVVNEILGCYLFRGDYAYLKNKNKYGYPSENYLDRQINVYFENKEMGLL